MSVLFAHSTAQILKEAGAQVATYLTRDYGHYGPALAGPTYRREAFLSPLPLLRQHGADLVVPMSIDWAQAPWQAELLDSGVPLLSPTGEGMRLERERDFARQLCLEFKIPFPRSYLARNRLEAEQVLAQHPLPFVIKNPLCSPTSPIHTILCETLQDTRAWLPRLDYAEGVFLQEYLGRCEAGHIALVSGGEIYSLVTNQEYKRAFDGNLGIVAGAPLGGLVEIDLEDKYGLARDLLHPLLALVARGWLPRPDSGNGGLSPKQMACHRIQHPDRGDLRGDAPPGPGPTPWRLSWQPLAMLRYSPGFDPIIFLAARSPWPATAIRTFRLRDRACLSRFSNRSPAISGGTKWRPPNRSACAPPAIESRMSWPSRQPFQPLSNWLMPISVSCAASAVTIVLTSASPFGLPPRGGSLCPYPQPIAIIAPPALFLEIVARPPLSWKFLPSALGTPLLALPSLRLD